MEVWQQFEKISRVINQSAKLKVRQAVPLYLDRSRTLQDSHSLHQAATAVLKGGFSRSSAAEMDVLVFYLLCVATVKEVNPNHNLDLMRERDEMESLRLQMSMDRRSKAMETLLNLLKKISNTAQEITQNIK